MISLAQLAIPGVESRFRSIVRETARDAAEIVQDAGLGPFETPSICSRTFLEDVVDEFSAMLQDTDCLSDDELKAEITDIAERMTPFEDFETIEIVRDFHLYRGNIVFLPPLQDGVYRWHELLRAAVMELAELIVGTLLEEFSIRLAESNGSLLEASPDQDSRDLFNRLIGALNDCIPERADCMALEATNWILQRTNQSGGRIALALLMDGHCLADATLAASACADQSTWHTTLGPDS